MISQESVLQKILKIREKDKRNAQLKHAKAVNDFETIATKLYSLLKKKEDTEQTLHHYIQSKAQITKLREHSIFIQTLSKQIEEVQQKVEVARSKMEQTQKELSEAHIEMKKIEKLIEKRVK